MKYTILLLACIISLAACTRTPEQKCEGAIKKYMQDNLDDPGSYESIMELANAGSGGWFVIQDFRAKNRMGALIKQEWTFELTKDYEIKKVYDEHAKVLYESSYLK